MAKKVQYACLILSKKLIEQFSIRTSTNKNLYCMNQTK